MAAPLPGGRGDSIPEVRFAGVGEELCIYCHQRPADSDEHILATWLIGELEKVTGHAATGGQLDRDGAQTPITLTLNKKGRRQFNFTSDMICARCNSGWMNVIDEQVRPYLSDLLAGHETNLSAKVRKRLATWAVKTAITARFAHVNPNATEEDWPNQLWRDGRPSLEWGVWVGRYVGPRELWYRQGSFDVENAVRLNPEGTKGEPPISRDGVVMTLILGQLYVQVVRVNGPAFPMTPLPNPAAIQIWPSREAGHWPPTTSLDDDASLEDFAARFYSGTVFLGVPVTSAESDSRQGPLFVRAVTQEDLDSDLNYVITFNQTCNLCGTTTPVPHDIGKPFRDLQLPYRVIEKANCSGCGSVIDIDVTLSSIPGPSA